MFSNDGKSIHHVKNVTNAYLWSLADTTHSSGCWWKFSSIFTLIFSSIFVLFSVHACALTIPFNLIDDFSYSEKAWQCHQSIYFGGVYVGQHICQYIHTFRLSTGNMHTHFSRIHNHSLAHTIYLSTCISRGASDQNSSIIYYNAHGFSTLPPPPHSLPRCALLPIFQHPVFQKFHFNQLHWMYRRMFDVTLYPSYYAYEKFIECQCMDLAVVSVSFGVVSISNCK